MNEHIDDKDIENNTSAPEPDNEPLNANRFVPNSRYFTIMMYGLMFVVGTILIYIFVGHFDITLKLLGKIINLISPFITGAFIAFILYPLVHILYHNIFIEKFHLKARTAKMLSILTAYIIAIGAVTILLVFIIPQVYDSISDITELLPMWYNNALNFILEFENEHAGIPFIDYDVINEKISSALPKIVDYLTGILTNLLPVIVSTSMAIVKGVLNFIIAIIVSVYMLSDHKIIFYHFKRLIYAMLPKKTADAARTIFHESSNIFSSFISGKFLDSLIIGIICFICMTIFRFPYAVLISVIVGITNIIPYFGPYIGGFIGGIIILIVNPIKVIFWAILILVIQQFDGLYLGPKILGEKTGLRPLWIIFSITVGGSLFGVIGMFLGVPCVAVMSYVLNLIIEHFLKKKEITVKEYSSTDEM